MHLIVKTEWLHMLVRVRFHPICCFQLRETLVECGKTEEKKILHGKKKSKNPSGCECPAIYCVNNLLLNSWSDLTVSIILQCIQYSIWQRRLWQDTKNSVSLLFVKHIDDRLIDHLIPFNNVRIRETINSSINWTDLWLSSVRWPYDLHSTLRNNHK